MAGIARAQQIAPPRANWGPRSSAPEWRWFWRQLGGLWRFDLPDTAYNVATRDGGDAGGHVLFAGSPEELANQDTYTSIFLKAELERSAAFVKEAEVDLEALDLDAMAGDDDEIEEEMVDEEEAAEAETVT